MYRVGFRTTPLLLAAALFAASGCRLFHEGAFRDIDRADDRVQAALKSQLRKDVWQGHPEWSLIRGTETDAAMIALADRRRWIYGGRLATALLDRLDATAANAELQRLAEEDSLEGWNALVLLAQRSPTAALRFESRLRELVATPLHYDSETHLRARSERNSAAAASREQGKPGTAAKDRAPPVALANLTLSQLVEMANADPLPTASRSKPTPWEELVALLDLKNSKKKSKEPPQRASRAVSESLRGAAAEAWCRVLAVSHRDPIDALAPAGRMLQRAKLPPDVRRELTLGIASRVPPALIPGVDASLLRTGKQDESTRLVRRTGVEACVIHAIRLRTSPNDSLSRDSKASETSAARGLAQSRKRSRLNGSAWPKGIHAHRDDPDPEIRILYGRWLALSRDDEALSLLDLQSRLSIDKPVRRAAVVSIGLIGTDEARRLLRDVAKSGTVAMRIAAVKSLARWGARELMPFLDDESAGVRQNVAESLASGFKPESATLAERMLKDKSTTVQAACLAASAKWPDRYAVPLLLTAMRNAPVNVAAQAWQALRKRRPGVTGYTIRGDERDRSESVDRLLARFPLPADRVWPSLAEISALPVAERQRLRQAVQRDVAVLVRISRRALAPGLSPNSPEPGASARRLMRRPNDADAVERLAGLGRDAVPDVEREIAASLGAYPRRVYRALLDDVLPRMHPAYAALRDLNQADSRARWNAVQKLSDLGQQSSLSPLVVKTLHERISDWRNRAVWQAAMQAVLKDAHPEADALAIAASQNPSPSVQALACEYFRRHPQTRFADRILELMNSRDKSVRLAAVEAAGYCHHQRLIDGDPLKVESWQKLPASVTKIEQSTGKQPKLAASATAARFGLIHWATAADRTVADAAVMSLARLGDETGYRQLHLMSHAADPKRRRKAYEMMGKTGRTQFLSRLIERGKDEKAGELKKAVLNALNELTPPSDRPVGLSRISGYHEQIAAWHERVEGRNVESRRSKNQTVHVRIPD